MRARRVAFVEAGRVVTQAFDLKDPGPDEILVETLYSAISPGTELAFLNAKPGTITATRGFPFTPGYSSVGEITAVGSAVESFRVGQRVATLSPHVSHALFPETVGPGKAPKAHAEKFRSPIAPNAPFAPLHYLWPLAEGLDPAQLQSSAAFNLASIGMTGARVARIELGESVLVLGLGPIGLTAGWAAHAAGAFPLTGVDPVRPRRDLAKRYGFDAVHASAEAYAGEAPAVVIEATGRPEAIPLAFKLCARNGRVVLLGSTRGAVDGVDFYNDVHRKGLSVIGVQVLTRPIHESQPGRWTAWDENALALRLISAGRLDVEAFVERQFPADCAADAYAQLQSSPEALGALLNWTDR